MLGFTNFATCLRLAAILAAMLAILVGSVGCSVPLDEVDTVFYSWNGNRVFCAKNIDELTGINRTEILEAMERARNQQQVLQLFAHTPGKTVSIPMLDFVFAAAVERGLPFLTYRDLLDDSSPRAGISFSFDDSAVSQWVGVRDLLKQYNVRASFFVSRYYRFDAALKLQLRQLAADGHQIEAHGRTHQRSPNYVESYGVRALLDEEVLPSLQLLAADGFNPQIFAYPFGARTSETDAAIMPYVQAVRSLSFTRGKPAIYDPCP
jgi:hypothetical protein